MIVALTITDSFSVVLRDKDTIDGPGIEVSKEVANICIRSSDNSY